MAGRSYGDHQPEVVYQGKRYWLDIGAHKHNNEVLTMSVNLYPANTNGLQQIPITQQPFGDDQHYDLGQSFVDEAACPGISEALEKAGLARRVYEDEASGASHSRLYQFDCKQLYDLDGFIQYRDDWKETFNHEGEYQKTPPREGGYFYKEEVNPDAVSFYDTHPDFNLTPIGVRKDGEQSQGKYELCLPKDWVKPIMRFDGKGQYAIPTGRVKIEMEPRAGTKDFPACVYVDRSAVQYSEDGSHAYVNLGAGARIRFGDNGKEQWKPAAYIKSVGESRVVSYETRIGQPSVPSYSEPREKVNQDAITVFDGIQSENTIETPQ